VPHRDAIHSAYGKIDRLEKEKLELEKRLNTGKKEKVKCKECGGRFARIGKALFNAGVSAILMVVMLVIPYNLIVYNEATHCYVESYQHDDRYRMDLMRNVDWGKDYLIGRYRNMDVAIKEAALLKCEIK
jgi:hypothetical protein